MELDTIGNVVSTIEDDAELPTIGDDIKIATIGYDIEWMDLEII